MRKPRALSSHQIEVLLQCPEEEFNNKILTPDDREFLYPLMHKGFLTRWRCEDPNNRITMYWLTEKGVEKKKECMVNVAQLV